ncbi:aspartate aminotransferase family protein [Ruminococcaceae bacterium OttesenSCG-928-I18]|nr:aspartate aminotransferase family protein [Ruminococcaceae bacterium OttesenSCG-928-I18]
MTFAETKHLDEQYIMPTYGRFGLCLTEGKGCRVKDAEGKTYLDFTAGIGVNSLGWCDDEWAAAVCKQAGLLQHTSNLFYTQPGALLAKKLCERTGMDKVFFANSGAEANEGAIKAARKYSRKKYGKDRSTILSITNSFHGRTMAALSATGQTELQKDFDPMVPGFRHIPAGDATALATALGPDVCALMIEPIQGEGGVLPFDKEYMEMIESVCRPRDILIIADEIQTGVGRTGHFLASSLYGLHPDIVTLAKGLGSGLPIGAVLFRDTCSDSLGKGEHGTTFGMNPICCAGANVVMDRLDEAFLEDVAEKGQWFHKQLAALPSVTQVSGAGLMWGLSFAPPITAASVREEAQNRGLLCLLAKSRLRLLPPLIISKEELKEGLSILQTVLEKLS